MKRAQLASGFRAGHWSGDGRPGSEPVLWAWCYGWPGGGGQEVRGIGETRRDRVVQIRVHHSSLMNHMTGSFPFFVWTLYGSSHYQKSEEKAAVDTKARMGIHCSRALK